MIVSLLSIFHQYEEWNTYLVFY